MSGMKAVFASPYLAGIAGFIALMTFASTILYFAQSDLVYEAMTDRGERTAFLASSALGLVCWLLFVAACNWEASRIDCSLRNL